MKRTQKNLKPVISRPGRYAEDINAAKVMISGLKAKLKTKTAALETKMDELGAMMSEARKVVKLEMESESWKSFGISASR